MVGKWPIMELGPIREFKKDARVVRKRVAHIADELVDEVASL